MKELIKMKVEHAYYVKQTKRRCGIVPDRETAEFMKKNRMIIHNSANEWAVVCTRELKELWKPLGANEEVVVLDFDLIPDDRMFYIASSVSYKEKGICCICNKDEKDVVEVERCSRKECGEYERNANALQRMVWRVHLEFTDRELLEGNKTVCVKFPNVSTLWEYCVFCNEEKDGLSVTDGKGDNEFTMIKGEWIQGEKVLYTFTSKREIPVYEGVSEKFQLQEMKNGLAWPIIGKLPSAGPGGIHKVKQSDDDLVSSVFINL